MTRDSSTPTLILLLGSYDPETKRVLYEIREHIARSFHEHVYGMLLERLEMYDCVRDGQPHVLMVECGEEPAAYLFTPTGQLLDAIPLESTGPEGAGEAARKLGLELRFRLPVLEELSALAHFPDLLTMVVRHRELTRCGEYIELVFLLTQGVEPRRVVFLWNVNVPISTMLRELLDRYNFNLRTYKDERELLEETHRLVYYAVRGRGG